jgi:hypothetical protein
LKKWRTFSASAAAAVNEGGGDQPAHLELDLARISFQYRNEEGGCVAENSARSGTYFWIAVGMIVTMFAGFSFTCIGASIVSTSRAWR